MLKALGPFLCSSRPEAVKDFPCSVGMVPVQGHGRLPVADTEGCGVVTAVMELALEWQLHSAHVQLFLTQAGVGQRYCSGEPHSPQQHPMSPTGHGNSPIPFHGILLFPPSELLYTSKIPPGNSLIPMVPDRTPSPSQDPRSPPLASPLPDLPADPVQPHSAVAWMASAGEE